MQALGYLLLASAANRILLGVRRLREPKYLAGILATIAYFWVFVFGPMSRAGERAGDAAEFVATYGGVIQSLGALLLFLGRATCWLLPNKRAALRFTETEVNVLFPAPVDRRVLVHFKLLKLQIGTLLSVLIFVVIAALLRPGIARVELALTWWLLFNLIQLHALGAAFARERMLDRGAPGWRRRALVGGLMAVVVLGALAYAWSATGQAGWGQGPLGFLGLIRDALEKGPLSVLLEPFRWLVRPMFAERGLPFLLAFLPLLATAVLHYFWVVRSCVAFEEASVELSEKSARQMETLLSRANRGLPLNLKPQPDAFRLGPVGRPEFALTWKNLTLLGKWGRLRSVPLVVILPGLIGWAIGMYAPIFVDIMTGSIAFSLLAFTLFSGGQMLRFDLRQDVHHLDVLKTLPLSGAEMVRGELWAPVWTLFTWQLALLSLTFPLLACNAGGREFLFDSGWWVLYPILIVAAPLLNALNFLLANALFLLFPAWYQVDPTNAQGLARVGQGLIQMLFQSILMMVILVPTSAVLFAFGFAGARLAGSAEGALFAVIPAALPLLLAIWFFAEAVGRDFEEFDIARDLK